MKKVFRKFSPFVPFLMFIFLLSIILSGYFSSSASNIAYAQLSGCGQIDIGNPGANVSIPPQCQSDGGGLKDPFPGGWEPSRLDMGYDGTFKGKIIAPFSGKIVYAATGVATWGGYIEIQADQKPAGLPTSTLYFAEGVGPLVRTGQHVNAGDPIAQAVPNSIYNGIVGNIEFGVSENGPGYVDAYALKLGAGHCPNWTTASRAMVHSFAQWAKTVLHVPGTPTLTGGTTDCAGSA